MVNAAVIIEGENFLPRGNYERANTWPERKGANPKRGSYTDAQSA